MKIYLAGNPGIKKNEIRWSKKFNDRSRLLSYWDICIETHRAGDFAFMLISKSKKNIK